MLTQTDPGATRVLAVDGDLVREDAPVLGFEPQAATARVAAFRACLACGVLILDAAGRVADQAPGALGSTSIETTLDRLLATPTAAPSASTTL